jgi:virulence-associated protein VapD
MFEYYDYLVRTYNTIASIFHLLSFIQEISSIYYCIWNIRMKQIMKRKLVHIL